MKLHFFGHAAVGITTDHSPSPGLKVLFDPYEPGGFNGMVAHPPIDFDPDQIFITHTHADHSFTAPFPDAQIISPAEHPGAFDTPAARNVKLKGIEVDHDAWSGHLRGGKSWVLKMVLDGLSVVHLGDIGEMPCQRRLELINGGEPVDVLLMTCGGYYTIGATEAAELALRLSARLIIPIHTGGARCTLPQLDGVEVVGRHYTSTKEHRGPLELNSSAMPPAGSVIVLGA